MTRDAWTTYARQNGLIQADVIPPAVQPANKYHAIPTHIDGVRFASKKEAARFLELRLLEKHNLIADLTIQPVFPLHVMELWRSGLPIRITTIGRYTGDFQYVDLQTGEIVIEDTKSEPTRTTDYRLRKRLAEVIHGVTITER